MTSHRHLRKWLDEYDRKLARRTAYREHVREREEKNYVSKHRESYGADHCGSDESLVRRDRLVTIWTNHRESCTLNCSPSEWCHCNQAIGAGCQLNRKSTRTSVFVLSGSSTACRLCHINQQQIRIGFSLTSVPRHSFMGDEVCLLCIVRFYLWKRNLSRNAVYRVGPKAPSKWQQETDEQLWFYWLMSLLKLESESLTKRREAYKRDRRRELHLINQRNRPMYGPPRPPFEERIHSAHGSEK
jgi:hypothetical protein